MATKHVVCITHLKWAPCLIKEDYKHECFISTKRDSTDILRAYHSGKLSRALVEKRLLDIYPNHKVHWVDGI